MLGVKSVSFDNFPDNQMDSVVLLDIVKVIESTISKYKPEMIFTHHSGDLNVDHRVVNKAVVTACRPLANNSVKTVLFYEIPSSTEWQIPSAYPVFTPNWFVDISVELVCKIEALQAYRDELRSWPHPRSVKGVEYLAHWRGATISVDAAEAFVLGRMLS